MLSLSANAQIINIPNAYFKTVLTTNPCSMQPNGINNDVDTNNDGEIQLSEALAVTGLDLNAYSLTTISGIENFTNLTELYLAENNFGGALNLSMLTQLEKLSCDYCGLTSLNVDGLSNLNELFAGGNNFTELDLSTTGVVDFYINSCTSLRYLNIKNGHTTFNCTLLLNGSMTCSQWQGCTSLEIICVDDSELQYLFPVPNSFTNLITYCSFVPGGTYNTINGSVNVDCGGTNTSATNQTVLVSGATTNGLTAADVNGQYRFYTGLGAQTISLPASISNYFTVSPANYTFNFTTTGNTQTANFCLTPNGNHPDLEVILLPLYGARPGFDAGYQIIYKNKGNQTQSGSVTFNFEDSVLDYVSSIPAFSSQAVNQLTWNFTNLAPFESRSVYITLNVNSPQETPPVANGRLLHFQTAITSALTDETPLDNAMNFTQLVVGSFDPNDKTVVQGSQIGLSQTGDYLDYVIRFQNTGTAAAENIVIKDMLSDKLDWSTIQMISSSHPYRYTLTSGNKLEVFYQNINLPATAIDEPGSHGYIAFKIKPKATVVLNDAIQNRASIYFDFNFPILTNMVTTTVSNLGIDAYQNAKLFSVYPNPTSGLLNIAMMDDQSVRKVTITNLLGQNILTSENTTIDISSLTKGTYYLKVETESGIVTQKIIKL